MSFEVAPGEAYGLVGSRDAASRPPPTRRCGTCRERPHHRRTRPRRRRDITRCRAASCAVPGPRGVDGVPGPRRGAEPVAAHRPQVVECFPCSGSRRHEAKAALDALRRVRIADPVRVMQRYPHQLSGGMQQRVVIAMALACDPKLLVLDEPTTGLDATVEAEVLDLVRTLRSETDAAILLIAHNLGVIRTMCDRVGVMYAGKIVEEGPPSRCSTIRSTLHGGAAQLSAAPRHPQGRAPADDDSRHAAPDRHAAADVRVRRPLSARQRDLPGQSPRWGGRPGRGPGATTPTGSARSWRPTTPRASKRPRARVVFEMQRRVEDVPSALATTYPRSSASTSASRRARRSASSVNRAPASRLWPR